MATRKWKSEFLVNTSTAGNQTGAGVTALADGGFVIAWLDDGPAADIIRFQRFDALGNKVGGEASYNQFYPGANDTGLAITTLSDGRFSIVGGEEFLVGDLDIYQTIYNADGTVGTAVTIAGSGNDEIEQSVAALAGGAQVVVYTDMGSNSGDVRFKIFNDVNTAGTSGIVNTNAGTLGTLQNQPQVAANPAGDKFAVVWADSGLNVGDIRMAVYNYDSGTNTAFLFNGEIGIDSITDDVQSAPDVAFLDNTRVVVAWRTEVGINTHGDGSVSAIKYAIYGIGNVTLLGERLANTSVAGGQLNPEVVALKNGNFVIAWTDNSGSGVDGSLASIRLQAFNSVGDKIGGEITVNTTTTGNQEDVSLTALADGRLVVTWTDYSDGLTGDIRAQIVDPRDGIVDGTSAADTLYGHDAIGDIISGGAGGDTLYGLDGFDSLYGGEGGDLLDGGLGADHMDGGKGIDTYIVDNIGDVIIENVLGDLDGVQCKVSYTLTEGAYIDILRTISTSATNAINLTGNSIGQSILGNAGINVLDGGGGAAQDNLEGMAGNDIYIIRSSNDLIIEGVGQGTADRVRTTVSFALAADDNIEFLETLVPTGVGGINLTGNSLAQTITGNNGGGIIRGAGGADSLRGNLGNDSFFYAAVAEGNDKLLDFKSNAVGNNDRFTFLNANFGNVGLGALQAAEFQSGVSNVALAAGVRFFYETDTRILRFDSNGSGGGGATVIATLQAGATFVIGDILIV